MDRSTLIERLMATFLGELGDHVRAINRDLLALEKGAGEPARSEHLQSLFRAVHSLKGAARSVSVATIEEACQRLEAVLAQVRDGFVPTDANFFALMFAAADALEEAGMRLREQRDLSDSPLQALLPSLEGLDLGRPAGHGATPSPRPPMIDEPAAAGPHPPPTPPATPPAAPEFGSPPTRPSPPPERAAVATHVRVPAERLDALLSRGGELLVARQGFTTWARRLESIRESVASWRTEWKALEGPLRRRAEREPGGEAAEGLDRRAVAALSLTSERLVRLEADLEHLDRDFAVNRRQWSRSVTRLDEEVRRARMLPFSEACQGIERAARDIARESGRRVAITIEGGDVELDRSVLEGLKDPLMHLVRNAVDHGLEPPERRRAAGKPEEGRITIGAALLGAQVEIVVADDGPGLDLEALRALAARRGLPESLCGTELEALIFQPGVSTAAEVTSVSGRGVGLDVVKDRLEALHGAIRWTSRPGLGLRFTLSVPLTLTTFRALLVEAGGQTFALASTNVRQVTRIDPAEIRTIEGRAMLARGGPPLPVCSLAEVLGLPPHGPTESRFIPAVVVAAGERRMAFLVDGLVAEQEIIVKGLGPRIRRSRFVSGATILPSGQVALVLNAGGIARGSECRPTALSAGAASHGVAPPTRRRLLVVDDSVTTRTLEKSLLEAAGYEVATAVDGEDAWRVLQERGADLIVSDVEMPKMDGFALTEAVRASPRFARLPVVLFTSRADPGDRARGAEAGADAYVVKGAAEHGDLLEAIAQLL